MSAGIEFDPKAVQYPAKIESRLLTDGLVD